MRMIAGSGSRIQNNKKLNLKENDLKQDFMQAWDYIYGSKSHMNLAGKIFIGIPFFPYIFIVVAAYIILDNLFSKKGETK